MVLVAQLVRASLCGSEGREFEPRQAPIVYTSENHFVQYRTVEPRRSLLSVIIELMRTDVIGGTI